MRLIKPSATTLASTRFILILFATPANAAGLKDNVLYSFTGSDGYAPSGGLVADALGNLYGTTQFGGANNVGAVFELSPQTGGVWTESVLYSFKNDCIDGIEPFGTLVLDAAGNLYGTTTFGGPYATTCAPNFGNGTVFELTPPTGGSGAWTETILHNFTGVMGTSVDGTNPMGGVIFGQAGNLYGTTVHGGSQDEGTVFELIKNRGWEGHVMWNFSHHTDGINPASGLVVDAFGNLYGTTSLGGPAATGEGTVFEVTPEKGGNGTETVLYTFFQFGGTGTNPYGNLVIDAAGNLYGTTQGNGSQTPATRYDSEVFELSGSKLQVLYKFRGNGDGRNIMSGLVLDSAGNLYGTSYMGGTNLNCPDGPGIPAMSCGTVFKLTPGTGGVWTEQELHSFSFNGDGFWPQATLIFGPGGNLYGTTYGGGDVAACVPNTVWGCGTVFEIAP